MAARKFSKKSKTSVAESTAQAAQIPGVDALQSVETKETKPMSLEHSLPSILRQHEVQRPGRAPQLPLFEVYDAAEDVGTVRLLWLEAALKARRVPESEG